MNLGEFWERYDRWIITAVMVLVVGSFVLRGLVAAQAHTNSAAYDQRSYLGLGLNIREGRDLSDGKRHPMLSALLSLIAERDWPYYTKGKMMNVGLGALGLVVTFALGAKWFSPFVGCLSAALLSINPAFLHVSSLIMAEPLLMIFTLLAWFLMVRALTAERRRPLYAALAGVTTGLAYLTKATALQMVPAYLVVALIVYLKQQGWRLNGWWRVVLRPHVWLFLLCWIVSWLPLFVFNIGEYGNPLYNYNYKHEIFLDSPTERHFADLSEAPTLQTYLASHTVADMAYRLWFGLREVTRILFRALAPFDLGQWPIGYEIAWIALWIGLLIYLATRWQKLAAASQEYGPAVLIVGAMVVMSMIPLGWFVQASNVGPRFIILFCPMITILVVGGIRFLVRGEAAHGMTGLVVGVLAALGLVVAGLVVPLRGAVIAAPDLSRQPVVIDREANARGQQVLAWLEEGTPYGTRVLWGPSYTLPKWLYERKLSLKDVPSRVESIADIRQDMADRDLPYVLLDWEMIQRREAAFSPSFTYDYPYVEMHEQPDDWAIAGAFYGLPSNWMIFRSLSVMPPVYGTNYALGESVSLIGYEIYPERPAAGENLYVTLFWRCDVPLDRDYSVFVHALGQHGQMIGQSDGSPLDGFFPTSYWETGKAVADRRTIMIPSDQVGRDMMVIAGIYWWETMERLPVLDAEGVRVADDIISLGTWPVIAPAAGDGVDDGSD